MELNKKLMNTISSSLEVPESEITIELAAGHVENWDSLGHLKIILAIEKDFNVKFRTEKISELVTVKKIQAELYERGVLNDES